MDFIRQQAMDGTLLSHVEGGVPNVTLRTGSSRADPGRADLLLEYACGPVRLPAGREPFDQPGVEAYKRKYVA